MILRFSPVIEVQNCLFKRDVGVLHNFKKIGQSFVKIIYKQIGN